MAIVKGIIIISAGEIEVVHYYPTPPPEGYDAWMGDGLDVKFPVKPYDSGAWLREGPSPVDGFFKEGKYDPNKFVGLPLLPKK